MITRRTLLGVGLSAAVVTLSSVAATPMEVKYNLLPDKPFAGTKLNILSVVTPQFKGLELRDSEFTEMTGIETEWTYIPFVGLQEKVTAEGIAANGAYDVVNYLDSWGPPNAHWLMRIDELLARDGISMDRYPAAFARSAQFEGETLGFPLRAHPQLLFYRRDLIPEPPASWEEMIEVGKQLKESHPDIAPLALYFNNDGNRQNLFIWIRSFNDSEDVKEKEAAFYASPEWNGIMDHARSHLARIHVETMTSVMKVPAGA